MSRKLTSQDFIDRLERSGDCLEYVGPRHRDGYGKFGAGGRGAHVYSYLTFVSEIPEGKQVLHTCDNPPCVLPAHLWLGTHDDNMKDKTKKGRNISGGKKGKTYPHLQKNKPDCGHEYTYAHGRKFCRVCKNEKQRQYKARKRKEK